MDNGADNYRRFLDGDDNGIVMIIKEYKDGLILFLNSYVKNIHIAEELAEDTFYRLVIHKPTYRVKGSFKTWLYTIGRNRAINHLRFSARFADLPPEDLCQLRSEELSVEEAYLKKEERIQLHCAIKSLVPQYREVLYLHYFESLSFKEISRITKKSEKQIQNLTYRAKKALREKLELGGFVYEGL